MKITATFNDLPVEVKDIRRVVRDGCCTAWRANSKGPVSVSFQISPLETLVIKGDIYPEDPNRMVFSSGEYIGPDSLFPSVVKFASLLVLTRIKEKGMKKSLEEVERRMELEGTDGEDGKLETTKGIDNLDQGEAGSMRHDGGPKLPYPNSGLPATASWDGMEIIGVSEKSGPYYIEKDQIWKMEGNPDTPMKSAISKQDGSYIGDLELAERMVKKYGITEFYLADSKDTVASVGYNPKEKKWYGWSHRAIYGFGVGDRIEKGDSTDGSLPIGFEAKTLEDARKMARAFAKSVASKRK